MCGIFFYGKIDQEKFSFDKNKIKKSLSHLSLRGPDFQAIEYHNNFVIAHTRLSIIDPSSKSNQPFYDNSKNFILSFNGEIYNYLDLKKKLEKYKIVFRSNSDTEILLNCLIHFGIDETLNVVEGMFSFVFINKKENKIFIAKDKFGQKPLYYYFVKNNLIISSSINSILENLDNYTLNKNNMFLFLCPSGNQGTRGLFTDNQTFFNDIKSLEAGSYLIFSKNYKTKKKYFNVSELFSIDKYLKNKNTKEEDLIEQLSSCLNASIKYHSISDVNNGILLSGGIDSSLIHYYSKNLQKNLYSFTKISPDIESIPLKIVPHLTKNNKKSFFIEQNERHFLKDFTNLIKFGASPLRWGGAPAMYNICKFAKNKNIKVLLGGDCFDELFLGYSHYKNYLNKNFSSVSELCSAENKFHKNFLNIVNKHNSLQNDYKENINKILKDIKSIEEKNILAASMQDINFFLQTIVLPNSDLYSMMASTELRNPALFLNLIKFALNLPLKYKIGSNSVLKNKNILRKLAIKKMDKSINVKKEGTRNFALQISSKKYWKFDNFNVIDLIKYKGNLDQRDLFRILNLEAFINLYDGNSKESFYDKNLTDEGKKILL